MNSAPETLFLLGSLGWALLAVAAPIYSEIAGTPYGYKAAPYMAAGSLALLVLSAVSHQGERAREQLA